MGYIHITAYEGLKPLPNVAVHPDGYIVDHKGDVVKRAICPILNSSHRYYSEGLEPGTVYEYQSGLRIEMATVFQTLNFMEVLAEFAKYEPEKVVLDIVMRPYVGGAIKKRQGPFWELITLPTNKVIIGPSLAQKLYIDFERHRDKARAFDTNLDFHNGFYQQYLCWYQAFAMASNNGLVSIY